MGNKHSSSCKVKYLHAPLVSSNAGIKKLQNSLHAYEFATVIIRHSSYDELQAQVVAKCPYGYHCVIPIARRHHLMWSTHFLNEVDELTQPIFKVNPLLHFKKQSIP